MKIQYYNVFLCKNGERTDFDMSLLVDFIASKNNQERTVRLGSQNILFLNRLRKIKIGQDADGTTLTNHEFLKGNRSFWLGKFRNEKPYEGKVGTDEIKEIDGDLFEPSMCLLIPSAHLFLLERKFLGPSIKQIEEYFEEFIKSKIPNTNFTVRFEPITKETLRNLLPASESIKSITIQIKNEGFQLSNLFPSAQGNSKTLLEKLFGNMIEVSEELDINTTTIVFKKGRFKREMSIGKIDNILKLMNAEDKNLISAKVTFKNPITHAIDSFDLTTDGFYVTEKTSRKYERFEVLADLMTEHYYDDEKGSKNMEYLKFGNLLPLKDLEFEFQSTGKI